MPTYVYACTECDHGFEVRQSFADPALTECPQCHGRLRKLFNSVGIVFKGSGFYRTDSRDGAKARAADGGSKGSTEGASNGSASDGTSSNGSSSDGGSSNGGSSNGGSSGSSSDGSGKEKSSAASSGSKEKSSPARTSPGATPAAGAKSASTSAA